MKLNRAARDAIIFVVFAILIIIGLRSIFPHTDVGTESTNQKHAIAELGYCSASDAKPCVVSFSIDTQGSMFIDLVTPRATYPEFYVTITSASANNRYECTRLPNLPTNILCTGPQLNPGEPLHFSLFATDDNRLLAEGTFNIIGLMLATPGVGVTTTPTETVTETDTPGVIDLFEATSTPVPASTTILFPTVTTAVTSYPNPSYSNSTYP